MSRQFFGWEIKAWVYIAKKAHESKLILSDCWLHNIKCLINLISLDFFFVHLFVKLEISWNPSSHNPCMFIKKGKGILYYCLHVRMYTEKARLLMAIKWVTWWLSFFFMKMDGGLYPCTDCGALNLTVRFRCSLPLVSAAFQKFIKQPSFFFIKLDISSAYNLIFAWGGGKWKTALITTRGQYGNFFIPFDLIPWEMKYGDVPVVGLGRVNRYVQVQKTVRISRLPRYVVPSWTEMMAFGTGYSALPTSLELSPKYIGPFKSKYVKSCCLPTAASSQVAALTHHPEILPKSCFF